MAHGDEHQLFRGVHRSEVSIVQSTEVSIVQRCPSTNTSRTKDRNGVHVFKKQKVYNQCLTGVTSLLMLQFAQCSIKPKSNRPQCQGVNGFVQTRVSRGELTN